MNISTVVCLVASLLYSLLFVFSLRVKRRVNRIFSAYLLGMGLWTSTSVMWFADFPVLGDLPWLQTGMFFSIIAWMLMCLLYVVILGLESVTAIRAGLWAVYCLGGLLLIGDVGGQLIQVTRIERGYFDVQFGGLIYLFFALAGLSGVAFAFLFVLARIKTDDHNQRNRLLYLAISNILIIIGGLANISPQLRPFPFDVFFDVLAALLMAYAIYRYQLLDLTLVVRKGLLYSIPTAIIGVGYFLLISLVMRLFHAFAGPQIVLVSILVAAITAVVAQPLRDKVQSWIDRLFFREKYDASVMLQRLSRTAASVLDVHSLAEMILEETTATMHIARAAFFLKQEGSGEFRLAAQRGLDGNTGRRMRSDHPLVEWLPSHGSGLTRDEMEAMPQFRALWAQEREELDRIEAELFVPLLVRDELIGILILGPKLSEVPYSRDEQLTLTTLANQTAVAVENALLFAYERRKVRESSALLDIAKAVGSILDLSRLLQIIAQKTAEVCEVDRCTILLLDEGGDRLIPLMSQYRGGVEDKSLWRVFKERTYIETIDDVPLVKRVIREQQPIIVDEDSISLVPSRWTKPFGIRSILAVPLISKDTVIGLMALDHTEEGQRFTGEQVNLATMIGSQVAIAIENARLYEEVVEERDRTETILEQAFAGIMVIDSEMRIVTMNPGAEAITGYTAQEVLGKRLPELFGPDMWSEGSLVQTAMASGERVVPAEAALVSGKGACDVLLGVTSLGDGYLLSFADITHLKEVDRLKSDIVANVSHELRAPLASIKAYTELLLDELEDGDKATRRRFLSVVDREGDRLSGLINDLLDISRLEQRKVELQKKPLSISEVVNDILSVLDVAALERNIAIHLDLQAHLPMILANRDLMITLVKNLLSNAIKFSREGGQVDLTARKDGDNLVLNVVNRGIGISSEELPHLFEKFYRTETARKAGIKGTGLGLVLVKEAVQAHGGTIRVESELGVGTRFTVTLPVKGKRG